MVHFVALCYTIKYGFLAKTFIPDALYSVLHIIGLLLFILIIYLLQVQIHYCEPGSSVVTATELPGWTVRDRIPVGTRFSARPDRPWGPPSLLPGLSRG